MKTTAKCDLPDVNLWLALSAKRHSLHARAREYWETLRGREIGFCRVTMLGFLRLATHPQAMMGEPFSNEAAWEIYQAYLAMPECQLLSDPHFLDAVFSTLALAPELPHRLWTDAYLAAFAISTGCRLVTFDTDFQRFRNLDLLLLKP